MKPYILLLSLMALSNAYAKVSEDSYNLQPGSKEAFSCAVDFLQEKTEGADAVGGHYLAQLLKANVPAYVSGSYTIPDREKFVAKLIKECRDDWSVFQKNNTLPKHPPITQYYQKLSSVMLSIKNKLGLCWSNELSANVGLILSLGGGISGGQCFRADGKHYFDAGFFAEAGIGVGAHVGFIEDDLEAGKHFEKTGHTYISVGVGLIIDDSDQRFLNRIQGFSSGVGVTRVNRFHIHGKMFPLKPQVARAIRKAVDMSDISSHMQNEQALFKDQQSEHTEVVIKEIALGNYYSMGHYTNLDMRYTKISFLPNNVFEYTVYRFYHPNYNQGFEDKKVGTYTHEGNHYKVTYNQEHCNPIGEDNFTINIKHNGERLDVQSKGDWSYFINEKMVPDADRVIHPTIPFEQMLCK